MDVSGFMRKCFRHFNARETLEAAEAFRDHVRGGGMMVVSLAGAMSSGEMGWMLARMIRAGMVHAISCTGANLEEDIFNLMCRKEYEEIPRWRNLSPSDEAELIGRRLCRVTDTCIPESVMYQMEAFMVPLWKAAASAGARKFPYEYVYDVLRAGLFSPDVPREESWVLAASEANLPIWTPGWEDSTTGNGFAANVEKGVLPDHSCVKTGTEQFSDVMRWYRQNCDNGIGFFQIGGGIAGDFAICAVPCLLCDMREKVPFWSYFAQISDAVTSYGGYSGAPPNEKITWAKLEPETPAFMIQSDASIVAPLVFAYVLDD